MLDRFFHIFLVLLNYFWLSDDPVQSAKWYCDQHCFKIGAEVIESVWDAVLVLAPELSAKATSSGVPEVNRKKRHSKEGCLWHPLSVWNGLCRANMRRSLVNADAIFAEHYRRTKTKHSAWSDCKFLLKNVSKIDFNSSTWRKWYASQNGDEDTKYRPEKTKVKDLKLRALWMARHGHVSVGTTKVTVFTLDRNTCSMSEPPQCINDKLFPGCQVPGDPVEAYRRYYNLKLTSFKNGAEMRYFYSIPPPWLKGKVQRISAAVRKKFPYKLDDEGFCVVHFHEIK